MHLQKACELLRNCEQAMAEIRQENDSLRDRSNALENELRLQTRQNDLMSQQMLTEKRVHGDTMADLQKKIDELQSKISSMELRLAIQSFDRPVNYFNKYFILVVFFWGGGGSTKESVNLGPEMVDARYRPHKSVKSVDIS